MLNEFNKFLEKQDIEKLYKKWNVEDTSNIKIEKNSYQGEKTIKVGLISDSKPFCFLEKNEIKGLEIDLLYEFTKSISAILI